jgi:large subunit ribosomal protein L32
MAHPKRRQSKSRKNKRRTHYKITLSKMYFDRKTQKYHFMHHAHWHNNMLYYKGKILKKNNKAT